jgi:hypothetical protein
LSQQPYAPYALSHFIDRDNFKKLEEFNTYEQCVRNISDNELVELSNNQRNAD